MKIKLESLRNIRMTQLLLLLVVGYSILHIVYSVCRYNIFLGQGSGDVLRTFTELQYWRENGVLDYSGILHPPLYYAVLLPLAAFGFDVLRYTLYLVQFPLFFMAIIMLVKASITGEVKPVHYLIAGVLTVNFQPFLETLAMHKVEGFEFMLICVAIAAFKQRRDKWAGIWTMLAANLKYLPALLAVYFVVKRQWQVVLGLLIGFLVCLMVTIPIFGARTVASSLVKPAAMLVTHDHEGTRPQASIEFQTLQGTVNRLFVGREVMLQHFRSQGYAKVSKPETAWAIGNSLRILLLIIYLIIIRRRWKSQQREQMWPRFMCEISLTLVMIFILAQASRLNYAILLLPGFVMMGLMLYEHRERFGRVEKILFILAYALAAMIIPGGLLNRLPAHPVWGTFHSFAYFWMSLPFYGYLLLGVTSVICHARLASAKQPEIAVKQ